MAAARTIDRVLVANRGEVASRVFRTCRRLGIETVAVYSDADRDSPAVAEADLAVGIGGRAAAESYLQVERVLAAARASGADAIHPGYGFLSENADFAQAVLDEGLAWIGPTPAAMRAMGSKIEARELMESAGVPVLPARHLARDAALGDEGEQLGLPLLVKASAGGGGKGMRIVRDLTELPRAVDAARREAEAAFGDPTVFLERYLEQPRHIEIQVFADEHGNAVALFERDCSIQRRYQKIVEECPSPAVDGELRQRISETALTAARTIDYLGAGTVEFLLGPTGEFFFLEMNTRLQVEHPVTELVTGLDLVELQLLVAQGQALPEAALSPELRGHAIEARLYAEDPANEFLPSVGVLHRFAIPGPVRVDSGVADGSEVSSHYDPLLAKVIAHGSTRTAAARLLARSLRRAEIHGVATNRDLLVRALGHPVFLDEGPSTGFLDRADTRGLATPLLDDEAVDLCAAAAALAAQAARRETAPELAAAPSGWRNVASALQSVEYESARGVVRISYRLDRAGGLATLNVGDRTLDAVLLLCEPDRVELAVGGLRQAYSVRRYGDSTWINGPRGQTMLRELPRFADEQAAALPEGALVAPMPGAVIRVEVAAGDRVEARQALLVLEAMKMEHELVAPAASVVRELLVAKGDLVNAGQALAVLDQETTTEERP